MNLFEQSRSLYIANDFIERNMVLLFNLKSDLFTSIEKNKMIKEFNENLKTINHNLTSVKEIESLFQEVLND